MILKRLDIGVKTVLASIGQHRAEDYDGFGAFVPERPRLSVARVGNETILVR